MSKVEITYTLADPTGNRTVLVDTPVPVAFQPAVASALMQIEPTAEQVGFLTPGADGADIALRMAGGEFCGNATLSAAALAFARGSASPVRVRICGEVRPVTVRADGEGYIGEAELPAPTAIRRAMLPLSGGMTAFPIVELPGITHVIAEENLTETQAAKVIRTWCERLSADALGIMRLAGNTLSPLVYVPAADTLFWENSCASGTAAVGCYFAAEQKKAVRLALTEPGGVLTVSAAPGKAPVLSGNVCFLHTRTQILDNPAWTW